jgi:drug/metabolite transporter (DMT)-like permease
MVMDSRRGSIKADLALAGVTLIWGASFPIVKGALDDASPVLFLVLRFAFALLCSLPLVPAALSGGVSRRELGAGAILGVLLGVSFAVQTLGLTVIPPARSAFITALYVVFVPLLSFPLLGRAPRLASWAGCLLAFLGVTCLSWEATGLVVVGGDLLTLACAAGFALHIIGVSAFTPRYDFRRLYLVQIAVAGVVLLAALPLETPRLVSTPRLWGAILLTGGLCVALAFYVQNRVQQRTSANRAAIIFSLEPVFAALFTPLILPAEAAFGLKEIVGALLILGGVLVAEIRFSPDQSSGRPFPGASQRTDPSP